MVIVPHGVCGVNGATSAIIKEGKEGKTKALPCAENLPLLFIKKTETVDFTIHTWSVNEVAIVWNFSVLAFHLNSKTDNITCGINEHVHLVADRTKTPIKDAVTN